MRCPSLAESPEPALRMLPACSDCMVKLVCGAAARVQLVIGRGWGRMSSAAAAELVAGERLDPGLVTCEHLSLILRRPEKDKPRGKPVMVIKKWVSLVELSSVLAGQGWMARECN